MLEIEMIGDGAHPHAIGQPFASMPGPNGQQIAQTYKSGLQCEYGGQLIYGLTTLIGDGAAKASKTNAYTF